MRPLRFILVGVWNTVFGYLAFVGAYSLVTSLGLHYLWAAAPAHILAVTNAYLSHRTFVFRDRSRRMESLFRYSLVHWGYFGANITLLPLLVGFVGLHPLAAQAVLVIFTATTSYFVHTFFTFRAA